MAAIPNLIALKPTNPSRRAAIGDPNVRKVATGPKPVAPVPAAVVKAEAKAAAAAAAKVAREEKLKVTAAAAAAKLANPATYTASGALDFGVSTLRNLGLLPAAVDTGDPTRAGAASAPVTTTSATKASSGLGSFLPLALIAVAAWFLFLKK